MERVRTDQVKVGDVLMYGYNFYLTTKKAQSRGDAMVQPPEVVLFCAHDDELAHREPFSFGPTADRLTPEEAFAHRSHSGFNGV